MRSKEFPPGLGPRFALAIAFCAGLGFHQPAQAGAGRQDREGGQTGTASYYSRSFSGRTTASGTRMNPAGYHAAHRTLPFGTLVEVTNLRNGRSVVVRVDDRGPFRRGRVIDLTPQAALALGFARAGVTQVRLSVVPQYAALGPAGALDEVAEAP
ncbi:septal ring lytic transglycosylase RlpA family protein [Roseicella aquatilis]|uniref:Endolytic peptidoglycan transglycosylase RlpA n=1 Tax=Roseicella aquatilis TaxID=2527868 RepID=A0A4R4DWC4_9PROT|nr:septal ring lytic transglycosylase RlpA family protein [Roseicella aquatilis]TCZ66841.1 septal ring lytic transglycosylase RlpA family protein [Roseicella aquatilis]